MKVLIVKTSALGDIIHALPVLEYIHAAMPEVELGWVVEEHCSELLEGHPLLAHLHVIRSRSWRRSPFSKTTRRGTAEVVAAIRSVRYDCVLDIQGNLKSGLVGLLSGVGRRIGLPPSLLQERINTMFTTEKAPYSVADDHATLRCLSVAKVLCGAAYHGRPLHSDIFVSPEAEALVAGHLRLLKPGRKVLFHAGTTWQTKFWSPEGWQQLGRAVCERYPDVTIMLSWGNQAEQRAAEQIAAGIGERAVVAEQYGLKPFVALLKRMSLVVGGDTGPVHLAAAVGTPTVSLYRASDGSASGPRGDDHVLVQSPLPCSKCFRTSCWRDTECRASISVASMLAGVVRLLGSHGAACDI